MNVPKLRFKEFNDEYKKVKFGDIVNYQKGFAFKSKDYKNSGVRIIRISDTTNNSIKKIMLFI
ncbi:MAG: restriction endonuclease subunit S [Lachnospiraceae bacterium]